MNYEMKNPSMLSFSFTFVFFLWLPFSCCPAVAQNKSLNAIRTVFDVGIVLDFGTTMGKMSNVCISMALEDFYATHTKYTTKLNPLWRDSNKDSVHTISIALDLLKDVQVKAIIGPQTSPQAQFLAELGDTYQVPILSFSATSPLLSSIQTPYFIRTALSDSSQVKAIAAMVKAFGWREVVQICEDTPYKNGVMHSLSEALQEVHAHVPYRSMMSHLVTNDQIAQELYKLETMPTRVFIVHLSPSLSARLFSKANEVGMMSEGYVWIITYRQANLLDSMNSSVIRSMQGVLGVKPYFPITKELDSFMETWKRRFLIENPNYERVELNIFGLWAYDTVWALAKAVEEMRQITLGVSELGPRLRDAILKTNFIGQSGRFNLTSGQLESSAFQIVNVVGKRDREIGFWTPINGLEKKLNTRNNYYSTSKDDLNPIIWPGESVSVPKGWALPSNGKTLRIGVPKRYGFTEFVNVIDDPRTNKPTVIGYSIDVFEAAIKQLPYAVDYEFIPFEDEDGKQNGTYNDLIDQVFFKNFDAVVGDVTIVANRSLYVDFTLPYTESGVTLVVLVKENKNKAWIFLNPICWDVWLTTGAAFVFTGMVVWALEHQINDEFRGTLVHQVGVTLWFSFSTLVFAHRETLVSNWSKFVVIIWVFVVWILTTSYTASFTSLLTLQQLQPSVNDVSDLIKNRDNVGYQEGGFVVNLLRTMNVEESHLKAYRYAEEFAEALSNGSVTAIFDEIPYLRLFLAKNGNCGKYKMVGTIYKTGGFGFVFPMDSPLVPDMSRAILNVTQGPIMKLIEKKWIQAEPICSDQPTTATSNSLTLDSFWGLFLITGAASMSAFLIFLFKFLYKNGHLLCDSSVSFVQRLKAIIRRFDERDLTCHASRPKDDLAIRTGHAENTHPNVEASSPNANGRTIVVKSEFDTQPQDFHPLPLEREPIARRRWNMLYRALLFRSTYARLHHAEMIQGRNI